MSPQRLTVLAIRWLLLSLAVWAAAAILPGVHLDGWQSTLFVALILGLLNLYLRPILVLLALPVTILTLGLFIIVINATLLALTSWVAGQFDSIHFHVDSFGSAILGALIISLVSIVLGWFVNPERIAGDLTGSSDRYGSWHWRS